LDKIVGLYKAKKTLSVVEKEQPRVIKGEFQMGKEQGELTLNRAYWIDRNGRLKFGPNQMIFFPKNEGKNSFGVWGIDNISVPSKRNGLCETEKDIEGKGYVLSENIFDLDVLDENSQGIEGILSLNVEEYNRLDNYTKRFVTESTKKGIPLFVEIRLNDNHISVYKVYLTENEGK
jgi:hypothetical protein